MPTLSFQHRVSALILTLWMSTSPVLASAQSLQQGQVTSAIAASTTETVNLMVGDIFEVLPTSDIQNPTYSWILTQDRTFIQAGRAPTFRVRLVQPGTYTLIAEIDSQDLSQRITRTFTINAQPRPLGKIGTDQQGGTGTTIMSAGSGTALVATDPQTGPHGNVVLGSNQQLVKLTPINPDLKPLSLDVNTAVDSNGDGNPSNDVDNQDTFFQSYASPLYVWFASPITMRTMAITTIENGNAVTQNIEVDNLDYAQQNGLIVSPVSIVTNKTNDSTFNFTPQFTASQMPQSTLLYHWSFGDGQESLLMNPSHTYASNGTYSVHLQVSDLVNGSQVAVADTQVIVQSAQAGTGATAQTSSTATSAPSQTTGRGLSGTLGSLLWLVLIFVIFVVVGLVITFIVSKLRRGRPLDETFAELEKNIVGKESEEKKTPEPLTITPAPSKPIPTQADVVKREEEQTPPNPATQTPRINEAAAPSWLRKGLANQPAPEAKAEPKPEAPASQPKPAPQSAPKPTPVPQPQQTQPAPRPVQTSAPQPTATQQQAPLPSWLQPQSAAPAAQTRAPKPQPSVQPQQAPSSQPAPATPSPKTETPAPQPKPVTPPTPAPKPVTPRATETPTQDIPAPQPKPAPTPKPAVQPTPIVSPTQMQPKPTPAPQATPAQPPVSPTPQAAPKQVTQPNSTPSMPSAPKTEAPRVQTGNQDAKPASAPVAQSPAPALQPKPSTPAAEPTGKTPINAPQQIIPPPVQPVKPADSTGTDAPIAIIRADSIEEQKKEEKKEEDQKKEPPEPSA